VYFFSIFLQHDSTSSTLDVQFFIV